GDIVRVGDRPPVLPHDGAPEGEIRIPRPRIVDVQLLLRRPPPRPGRTRVPGARARVARHAALERPPEVDLSTGLLPGRRRVKRGIDVVARQRLIARTLIGWAPAGGIATCR